MNSKQQDGWEALILSIIKATGPLTDSQLIATLGYAEGRAYNGQSGESALEREDVRDIRRSIASLRKRRKLSISRGATISLGDKA